MFSPLRSALRRRLPRTLLAAVAAGGAASASTPAPASASGAAVDGRERNVIARVNAVRADHGLAPLRTGQRISRAADRHSLRQQRAGTLSHQLPGESPLAQRLRRAVHRMPVAEVVLWSARGARSAEIVRAWMDSPGHRAVLLSPDFRLAGVGIRSGRGGVFATVDVAAR